MENNKLDCQDQQVLFVIKQDDFICLSPFYISGWVRATENENLF